MACHHLKELYDLCQRHDLKLSSTDLIRIVCPKCGVQEVCPSILMEQYESRHAQEQEGRKAEDGGYSNS